MFRTVIVQYHPTLLDAKSLGLDEHYMIGKVALICWNAIVVLMLECY